jgi:hypothetical protein
MGALEFQVQHFKMPVELQQWLAQEAGAIDQEEQG